MIQKLDGTCLFFALALIFGCSNSHDSPAQPVKSVPQAEWIDLIGESGLRSWQTDGGNWFVAGDARLDPEDSGRLSPIDGQGVLINGNEGRTIDLHTLEEFGDVEAHIEFMIPQGSNSGVYFQGRYEIQIFDSFGKDSPTFSDCGGIYQRWIESEQKGFEGHPPRVNASLPAGEWQSFDVVFKAPKFDRAGNKIENARFIEVRHNGKVVHQEVEVTGPTRAATFDDEQKTGPFMVQGDHGPVAYRNIRLKKLE